MSGPVTKRYRREPIMLLYSLWSTGSPSSSRPSEVAVLIGVLLLHDLPNGTTLAQEIIASSIFSVIKILAIKNHQLDSTFLHVAFGSQSLLKPTSDQTNSDTN
jgi:hypothetical protein